MKTKMMLYWPFPSLDYKQVYPDYLIDFTWGQTQSTDSWDLIPSLSLSLICWFYSANYSLINSLSCTRLLTGSFCSFPWSRDCSQLISDGTAWCVAVWWKAGVLEMSLDVINEESGVLQCANSYFFLFYRNDGQDYNRLILQQTQVSHTCNCEDRAAVIHHVDNDYFRKASTVSLSLALWLEITTSVHHSVPAVVKNVENVIS